MAVWNNYKGLMKRALSYMYRAGLDGKPMNQVRADLYNMIWSYEELNRLEKSNLYQKLIEVARHCSGLNKDASQLSLYLTSRNTYDSLLSTLKRVNRRYKNRVNVANTKDMLRDSDNVFFICTVHQKPAPDHKDLQGKLYVDRYWRTKIDGRQLPAVQRLIKDNQIITVQDVMKEPYWLITRPNCLHRLVPIETNTVLLNTEKALSGEFAERVPLVKAEDYYKLRYHCVDKMIAVQDTPVLDNLRLKDKRRLGF